MAYPRTHIRSPELDDHLPRETGHLVHLLLHGLPFDDIPELDRSVHLGENRYGEGIPFGDQVAPLLVPRSLHAAPVRHLDVRPVRNGILPAAPSLIVQDMNLPVAVHDHQAAGFALDGIEIHESDDPVMPRLQGGMFLEFRRTADMEGPHGQLGTRFTDRLGGDDPDRLADIHETPAGQIAAVAHGADPVFRFAGQHRPDVDLLDPGVIDLFRQRLVDLLIGIYQHHLIVIGILDLFQNNPPQDAFAGRLDDFPALHQGGDIDPVDRTAVVLGNDAILSDIDEPPGEISRVGCFQCRIGKAFPGAVRGDEVLQHRQAFPEVRPNRGLDDLAGGLCHESSHPGKLPDLNGTSPGAGIGHHVDGVEAFALSLRPVGSDALFHADPAEHFDGNLLRRLGPDVDNLVIPLAVGDEPFHILFLDPEHILVGLGDDLLLEFGDDHVVDRDRNARPWSQI